MSIQIAVRLAEADLQRLDVLVAQGAFPTRAAAVRSGLDHVLREHRERGIEEAYRLAYAEQQPDEDERLVGEFGLGLGSNLIASEDASGG